MNLVLIIERHDPHGVDALIMDFVEALMLTDNLLNDKIIVTVHS